MNYNLEYLQVPRVTGPVMFDRLFDDLPDLLVAIETVVVLWENYPKARMMHGTQLKGYSSSYGPYYLVRESSPVDVPEFTGLCSYKRYYLPRIPVRQLGGSTNWEYPGLETSVNADLTVQVNSIQSVYYRNFNQDDAFNDVPIDLVTAPAILNSRESGSDEFASITVCEYFIPFVDTCPWYDYSNPEAPTLSTKLVTKLDDIQAIPKWKVVDANKAETRMITNTTTPNLTTYRSWYGSNKKLPVAQSTIDWVSYGGGKLNLLERKTTYVRPQ